MTKGLYVFVLVSAFVADKLFAQPTAGSRVCGAESGVQVCRDVVAPLSEMPVVDVESPLLGKLLFLLDIPTDIFARLAQGPEENREFHPKSNWAYRSEPSASPNAGKYDPARAPGPTAWQYRPKTSFAYRPKQSWSYDPDVFSRLWISNIQHDTRTDEVPTQTPGILLIPVQEVR